MNISEYRVAQLVVKSLAELVADNQVSLDHGYDSVGQLIFKISLMLRTNLAQRWELSTFYVVLVKDRVLITSYDIDVMAFRMAPEYYGEELYPIDELPLILKKIIKSSADYQGPDL